MQYVESSDREAYDGIVRNMGALAGYGLAMADLVDTVKQRLRDAEASGTPAEKVRNLELAKLGLKVLGASQLRTNKLELCGLEKALAGARRLEIVYRAFGYYRMAGVP